MTGMPAGQYIPGNSVIHRMNPRTKLLCFMLLLAAAIISDTLAKYAFISVSFAAIVIASGIPVKAAIGPVRRLYVFFLVIFAMNAFFFSGDDPMWSWWILRLTGKGMLQGMNVVMRVVLVMVLASVLTSTTPPMELCSAITYFIKPLGIFRIPVEDVSMILSAAIQFIPTLLETTGDIKKAQIARGARFESKKLSQRAASLAPLVVPVFLSAFRRADELSSAMEARGYRNGKERTKRKSKPFRPADTVSVMLGAAVLLLQIYVI